MADTPITREEKYLAYLTGDYKGDIPKPITRRERYLYELCLKGMGGEISPEEIKNAVNEYLEKNPVKPGATTEQAQQIEQNKTDIASLKTETASLKEDISTKITKFYASSQGETHLADPDNGKIQDMMIYGKSSQDGTPTLENPVEIKSVVNPTVKVCGKNLLKATLQTATVNGVTCTNNGDGTYTLNGTASGGNPSFRIGKIIAKSGRKLVGSPGAAGSYVSYLPNGTWNNVTEEKGDGSIISNIGKGTDEIAIVVLNGTTVKNLLFKPMLTTDLTATYDDFEPYHEQTVTLPYTLNAIPVSSGGNVTIDGQQYIADYVDVERGKLVRMVGECIISDMNQITRITTNTFFVYGIDNPFVINDGNDDIARLQTNKYQGVATMNRANNKYFYRCWMSTHDNNKPIAFHSNTDDLSTFKNEVYGTKILYQLATPVEIDLAPEEIKAFKVLATYYPTTNISVNSEQLDGYTVFNYPISMANGWNYVKQQLNDNRDYIYDMDLQSAEAYVNSEYAVALTELEV